jgi:hypothetical protein
MMATDPGNQKENSPDHKDEPALDEAGRGDEGSRDGDLVADDSVAVVADHGNQAANVATPRTDVIGTESAGTGDLPGDDDLLGALTSMPSVAMSNIDQTLDQLTNSTDLFDVPALDFYDDLPT